MNLRVIAILVGGGIVVFLLYRFLKQRQSAGAVTTRGAPTLQQRIDASFKLDAWAKQFGAWWTDELNKAGGQPTDYTPTPPANAPPQPTQPLCPSGLTWRPEFGICN